MSGIDRWLDALEKKFTKLLAPPPAPDPWMAARDHLHIDIVACGVVNAAEWEATAVEAELRNMALLRSKYAHDAFAGIQGTLGAAALRTGPFGLVITMSYDPWEPGPPAWTPEPVEPVRPRPVPNHLEPEPAAPVPGTGPEHVWPRWG